MKLILSLKIVYATTELSISFNRFEILQT